MKTNLYSHLYPSLTTSLSIITLISLRLPGSDPDCCSVYWLIIVEIPVTILDIKFVTQLILTGF